MLGGGGLFLCLAIGAPPGYVLRGKRREGNTMGKWWSLIVALAGAVALAIVATTPPEPVPVSAPASAFSAARAMETVREIGRLPHPAGSAEHERVRGYLAQRLAAMGFAVRTADVPLSATGRKSVDKQGGRNVPSPQLVNVVATYAGTAPALPAVLLMAHYDSVWGSPAAADDGAGVASVLEAARAILSEGKPRRTLIVLLTDGEELGLDGAHGFFTGDPERSKVGVVINTEARGGGGRTSMFETGDDNGAMMRLFAGAVHRPVASSLSVFIYKVLPNDTDMTESKAVGLPGFNFAFIGRPQLYHSPAATPDALDQGALQDMGRQVLDTARALLAAPELPGKAPDLVFFDVFGLFLVSYAAWVGWVLLGLAVAGYAVAGWGRAKAGAIGRGFAATLLTVFIAAALLWAFNWLSGAGPHVNYYDRLAAIPRLEAQGLLVCVATWILVTGWIGARRDEAVPGFTLGAALPLLALAVFAQVKAPTASYPLILPLLLGGLAAAASRLGAVSGRVAAIVAATLGIGYLLTIGHLLMEAVGPVMPMVAALPLALAAILAWPLVRIAEARRTTLAGLALLVIAGGLALWVRFDALAPTVAVYSSDH